jgi:hypothetical protein
MGYRLSNSSRNHVACKDPSRLIGGEPLLCHFYSSEDAYYFFLWSSRWCLYSWRGCCLMPRGSGGVTVPGTMSSQSYLELSHLLARHIGYQSSSCFENRESDWCSYPTGNS